MAEQGSEWGPKGHNLLEVWKNASQWNQKVEKSHITSSKSLGFRLGAEEQVWSDDKGVSETPMTVGLLSTTKSSEYYHHVHSLLETYNCVRMCVHMWGVGYIKRVRTPPHHGKWCGE